MSHEALSGHTCKSSFCAESWLRRCSFCCGVTTPSWQADLTYAPSSQKGFQGRTYYAVSRSEPRASPCATNVQRPDAQVAELLDPSGRAVLPQHVESFRKFCTLNRTAVNRRV